MRTGGPDELLSGFAGYEPVVASWFGGRCLAERVPIVSGRVTATVTQQVPEKLTLRVPRWDGRDWLPGADPEHPLARFGQELTVSVVMTSAVNSAKYETRVGRFLVIDSSFDDPSGDVVVTAAGMLQVPADDKLKSPLAPRFDGSLASEARRLLPMGMFAGFDPALVDRRCPQTMEWPEDRLKALYEIADAWPARLRTDPWGQVRFLPPLPPVPRPIATLRDGERGTVISVPRSDTRDGGFNEVVVRSSATGRESVQAVATQRTGPMAVSTYRAVTKFWSSPLVASSGGAVDVAESMLRSSLLPTRTIPVQCVPDPRLDLDDPVEVIRDGKTDWGWVVGYDLPLTATDGAMRLDVGVPA